MNHPDSQGRHDLLLQMYAFQTQRSAPGPNSSQTERDQWTVWLHSGKPLKQALDRVINLENELDRLRAKAAAWDHFVSAAEHSSISSVELSGDMAAPNKWIATGNTLDGDFFEAMPATTAEQAVENLAEALRERDSAGMEDG